MKNDLRDSGLESFLRLLEPELGLPQAAVEPQEIRLRLDKEDEKEIPLRIINKGRGYLSGTIELSEQLSGLSLSANRFGLDSKIDSTDREMSVGLRVNAKRLTSGRDYRLSLVINTNGTPEKLVIPVSVLATDRKAMIRARKKWLLRVSFVVVLIFGLTVIWQNTDAKVRSSITRTVFGELNAVAIHDFQATRENDLIRVAFSLADAEGRLLPEIDATIFFFASDGRGNVRLSHIFFLYRSLWKETFSRQHHIIRSGIELNVRRADRDPIDRHIYIMVVNRHPDLDPIRWHIRGPLHVEEAKRLILLQIYQTYGHAALRTGDHPLIMTVVYPINGSLLR